MNYKVLSIIFIILFVVYGIVEWLFELVFYKEINYVNMVLFGAIAATLTTFLLHKTREIKTLRDVLKYKKESIALAKPLHPFQVERLKELLPLNHYILNTAKTTNSSIVFSAPKSLMDFGDIYTIKISSKELIISAKPKIAVNFTDTNNITNKRFQHIKAIVKTIL